MRYTVWLMLIAYAAMAGDEAKPLVDAGSPLSVATDHIVGYWSFDGGSFRDKSGNGNDGTPAGGVTNVAGIGSGAMRFDGVDDKITINDDPSLTSTQISGSFWIKPKITGGPLNYGVIAKATSATAGEYHVLLSVNTLYFRVVDNSTGGYRGRSIPYTDTSKWNHLTFSYDGSTSDTGIKVYLNGVEQSTSSSSYGSFTAIEDTSTDFTISHRGASVPFNGAIDEVLIYNKALSAAENRKLYLIGLARLRGNK